jgi:deoxyribodipyrimidine photolyase-related protein
MSNYCEKCTFNPDEMTGETACPFNALYWDFLVRHEEKFRRNQRMPYVFSTWDKFTPEKQKAIRAQAALSLQKMAEGIL